MNNTAVNNMVQAMLSIQEYLRKEAQYYSEPHIINKEYLDEAKAALVAAIATHNTTRYDHGAPANKSIQIMMRAIAAADKLLYLQDKYDDSNHIGYKHPEVYIAIQSIKKVVKSLQNDYRNPMGYKASSYHKWAFQK